MSAPLTYVSNTHIASSAAAEQRARGARARAQMGDDVMSSTDSERVASVSRGRPWSSGAAWLGLVGFTALLGGCKGETAVREEPLRPVKVAIVEAAPAARTLTYSGVVRPRIES